MGQKSGLAKESAEQGIREIRCCMQCHRHREFIRFLTMRSTPDQFREKASAAFSQEADLGV